MHQVKWTKQVYELFCEYAMLSEEERFIMKHRIEGKPITWMSIQLNCSESKIHRAVNLLKKKYDAVQKEHPTEMPERKYSAKETWMDSH